MTDVTQIVTGDVIIHQDITFLVLTSDFVEQSNQFCLLCRPLPDDWYRNRTTVLYAIYFDQGQKVDLVRKTDLVKVVEIRPVKKS